MASNKVSIFTNPLNYVEGIFCFKKRALAHSEASINQHFFKNLNLKLKWYYLFLIAICLFSCNLVFSQAKLQVKDAKKNFGFVKRGEVIKNEYEITNTGNEPLLIHDAEISCSCTTVDFPKQPILPGQKAIVLVIFNTTTVYGRQDREVFLNSNDPKSPAKLRYKGIVSGK